jgi:hypothetical protein
MNGSKTCSVVLVASIGMMTIRQSPAETEAIPVLKIAKRSKLQF